MDQILVEKLFIVPTERLHSGGKQYKQAVETQKGLMRSFNRGDHRWN